MTNVSSDCFALFRSLFRGRDDVFARHWESKTKNKSGYAPAKMHTGQYAPLTDAVLESHFQGVDLIGIYPLLPDNSTHLLAMDFDGDGWLIAAKKVTDTASKMNLPCLLERSKSGAGAHIWFFFAENIPAWKARRLGKILLLEAGITDRAVFDRLFPSQDEHVGKGLGNLIALPLHGKYVKDGNSCFIKTDGTPHPDQWDHLAKARRVPTSETDALITRIGFADTPEGDAVTEAILDRVPTVDSSVVQLTLDHEIFIPDAGLPDKLYKFLRKKLVFRNPEYLVTERRGFSTWNIPRWIYVLRRYEDGIVIPAGMLEEVKDFAEQNTLRLHTEDRQKKCAVVKIPSSLALRPEQERICARLLAHDRCILEAQPGFGKTMVGLQYILKRKESALIVVHTNELLRQWQKRIESCCTLKKGELGIIGSGKWKPGTKITVASYLTLARRGMDDIKDRFGTVVIDECHHVPATTFTRVIRSLPAKYVLGLTATAYRKDKLERLMTLFIGPILKMEFSTLQNGSSSTVPVTVHVRQTGFSPPQSASDFHQIGEHLTKNEVRNSLIVSDIVPLLEAGKKCLVLSGRVEHCKALLDMVRSRAKGIHAAVAEGTMTKKNRERLSKRIREDRFQLLIATGKLIGEGFDWPEVEYLFFAFPFSWKGNLTQYIGRVQRMTPDKKQAHVYDYVDFEVPMLQIMYFRRLRTYRSQHLEVKTDIKQKKSVSEQQLSLF